MTSSRSPLLAAGLLSLTAIVSVALAPSAAAHHLMEVSGLPQGPLAGLLSGLAHPVLGPDHLLFLLAIGLVGWARPISWIPALLGCGLVGSALGLIWPGLPGAEALVAGSLVLIAVVLQRGWDTRLLLPAIALHGYVLSATVIGWETTPLATYLLGLLISQGLLLMTAVLVVRRWRDRAGAQTLALVRGVLIGLGVAFAWSALGA